MERRAVGELKAAAGAQPAVAAAAVVAGVDPSPWQQSSQCAPIGPRGQQFIIG